MSVIDDMLQLNGVKKSDQATVLRLIADQLVKDNKAPLTVSEVIDILFGVTGYQSSPVPGGETFECSKVISLVMAYMTLRAQQLAGKDKNSQRQIETLQNLINASASLYGEVNANLPPNGEG